jgi:hypothetical protein
VKFPTVCQHRLEDWSRSSARVAMGIASESKLSPRPDWNGTPPFHPSRVKLLRQAWTRFSSDSSVVSLGQPSPDRREQSQNPSRRASPPAQRARGDRGAFARPGRGRRATSPYLIQVRAVNECGEGAAVNRGQGVQSQADSGACAVRDHQSKACRDELRTRPTEIKVDRDVRRRADD